MLVGLMLLAGAAGATPLLDLPGRITWRLLEEPPAEAFMIDADGMHYVRSDSDDSYVRCLPDGDPGHPDAVRDFGQARRGFRSHALLVRAADRSAVYAIEQRSLGDHSLRVLRLDCRAPDPERIGEELVRLTGEGHPFAELVRSERQRGIVPEQRPDGRLCLAGFGGVTCFDPTAPDPLPERVVDADALMDAEPVDPYYIGAVGRDDRRLLVDVDQRVEDVVPGPDGRLLFSFVRTMHFADEEPPGFGLDALETLQLYELTADDRVVVRSPQWRPGGLTPLTRPSFYWPAIDAWIGRTPQPWQYSDGAAANGGAIPSAGNRSSAGFMVVPADRSGFGYVPYTRALVLAYDCTECSSAAGQSRFRVADDGRLLVHFLPGTGRGVVEQVYAVEIDAGTLDLDDDGLERDDEIALGTDPTRADSDGGGTPDRDEVRLWGTDPLDPSDDFASTVDPVGFGMSETGLIKLRLPEPPNGTRYGWGNLTGAGPLCFDSGECYGPDGRVVAKLPPSASVVAFNSLDGEHLFYWQDGLLRARSIVTGADRALARADALPARDEGRPVIVVPVDDRRAWVADAAQVVWLEATPDAPEAARTTLLFDLDAARQAAGLSDRPVGAVNSPGWEGLKISALDVLGYHHESDQLVLGVAATYENWVLVAGRSGEARIVRHARELAGLRPDAARTAVVQPTDFPAGGLPHALRRIGTGGYLSLRAGFGPDLRRGPYPTRTGGFAGTVVWGGVGIRGVARGSGSFFPGLTALVGYPITVDPGDLLWFPNERDGDFVRQGTLYKSGRQGGFVRLMQGADEIFRRVVGADIGDTGRLCVVDHVPGEPWSDALLVLEPDGSGDRVPLSVRLVGEQQGLRDCAWADDGALHLLIADPPRLATLDMQTGDVVPYLELELPASAELLRLVDRPTEGFEVLHTADGLRGLNYGPSGRRLTLTTQNVLQIDGEPVSAPLQLVYDDRDRIDEVDPGIGLFADLIERPDGLVVIHPFRVELESVGRTWLTRHWVVDPATGAVAELGVGDHPVDGAKTIRVPGGEPRDPWTGELIAGLPNPGAGDVPQPPSAPTGGTPAPGGADEGCRAAPGSRVGPWWMGAALLLVAARRRSKH